MSHKLELKISKEEIYKYFIVENHSLEECGEHFGYTRNQMRILVKRLNIKKVQEIKIAKEALYDYYIIQNHTFEETLEYFHVARSCLCGKLKKYGITKPTEMRKKAEKQYKINKNDIVELYIKQNHTAQEVALKLKCSLRVLRRRLKEFNIVKDTQKRYENVTKSCLKNNGVLHPSQSDFFKDKMKKTNKEKYGVPYACMRKECRNFKGSNSQVNIDFAKKMKNLGLNFEREFALGTFVYDFKINDILIEINPTKTHNSTIGIFNDKPKKREYHLDKSENAQSKGYHCIHIFDWDDSNKIINLFLKEKEKVFARKCEIREISKIEADSFLEKYHLQGKSRGNIVNVGLFFNNELVELMTFGKPRYNKNYQWELLRLCSCKTVIGGSDKILKYFKNTYNPTNIISYCDSAKFDGNVYKNLGFSLLSQSKPCKHWCYFGRAKTNCRKHLTDNLLRQYGFDKLFNTNYGKGTSNTELMLEHNYVIVYDCGQSTYIKEF